MNHNVTLKSFSAKQFSFARHETFALRFGWLTKGYQGLVTNPNIFLDEDAVVHLGVGKNMVSSIRYWMLATRIAEIKGSHIQTSEIGHAIFANAGWDPYLEDEATIWLLHWLLASNSQYATAVYWFFNHFHKAEFSSDELFGSMKEFVSERLEGKKVADSSLRHDCNMLTRLYVPSKGDKRTPIDDALDSPLSILGLISKSAHSNRYISIPDGRRNVPLGVMGYAIGELFELNNQSSISIEAITHGYEAILGLGSAFRMTEECLVSRLEDLIAWIPSVFELRESAGIHSLYQLEKMLPIDFLNMHYELYEMEIAA